MFQLKGAVVALVGSDCSRRTGALSAAQRRLKDLTNPQGGGGSNLIAASVRPQWWWVATTSHCGQHSDLTRLQSSPSKVQAALCSVFLLLDCWQTTWSGSALLCSVSALPAKRRPPACSSQGRAVIMVSKGKIVVCIVNKVPALPCSRLTHEV